MTTTIEQHNAIAQVRKSFTDRIAKLNAELATHAPHQYIFAWDQYALGVKLIDGKPQTVCVSEATIYHAQPQGVWYTNGSNQKAKFISRAAALRRALRTIGASYAHLEEALAKTQA